MTLDEEYAGDSELLEQYKEDLLIPGWAGELTSAEFLYVKSQLKESASLRRIWGFRPSAKRLPEKRIRHIARCGLP
jgi:hypothetical protein